MNFLVLFFKIFGLCAGRTAMIPQYWKIQITLNKYFDNNFHISIELMI